MAAVGTLYIEEYSSMYYAEGRPHPIPEPPLAIQKITIDDTTSAESATLNSATKFVRLAVDGPDGGITWEEGVAPDADASSRWIPDNGVEFFRVLNVTSTEISVLGS